MTSNPRHDLDLVRESAKQLVHDVQLLDDAALAGPSLLPGWTRAHVVGHLIGNAVGLTNLLEWARTGVPQPQYTDREAREATVQAGVGQSAAILASRLQQATDTFVRLADLLTDDRWSAHVRLGAGADGREIPAGEVPWRRLVEQEVHNVDLAWAYTPAHWSPEFVDRLLVEVAERYLSRADVPAMAIDVLDSDFTATSGAAGDRVSVAGPAPAVLAWLTGRSSGEGLHVHPGPLPELPDWY